MNHQGGTRGANNRNQNINQNQVGATQTNSSSISPNVARREINTPDILLRSDRRRRHNIHIRLSPSLENYSGNTSTTVNNGALGNVLHDHHEVHRNNTINKTMSLPFKRTSSERQQLEGESSRRVPQAGPSFERAANNMRIEGSSQRRPTQHAPIFHQVSHGSLITSYVYTTRNPLLRTYSDNERENVEPFHGQRNNEGSTMIDHQIIRENRANNNTTNLQFLDGVANLLESLPNLLEQNGYFASNALVHVSRINMHEQEYHPMHGSVRNLINAQTIILTHGSLGIASSGWLQQMGPSIAAAIQVGGSTDQPSTSSGNAEQQPAARPLLSIIRESDFRDVMEARNLMFHEYQDLVRGFEMDQQNARTYPGISVEEIMKRINRENFEVLGDVNPNNKEACAICQEEYINGEELGRLDCVHRFHINCMKQWLVKKNVCPLCKRRGLFVADEAGEKDDV